MKRIGTKTLYQIFVYVALISLAVSIIIPVGWVFMASFKKNSEFLGGDISPWALPKSLNLDNFITAFNDAGMGEFFANSVIVTAIGIVLLLVLALPAAYVLARFFFKGKKVLEIGFDFRHVFFDIA